MRVKFNRKLPVVVAGVVAALAVAAASAAETLPKEGRYDYTACWSGAANVIAFSKTQIALSFDLTGTDRSNPPGGFFDNVTFRCVGVRYSLEGKVAGNAVCETVDRDGDKTLDHYAIEPPKLTSIAGTGKYNGITLSGTATPLGPFKTIKPGTFQGCNHQTGTYKMK